VPGRETIGQDGSRHTKTIQSRERGVARQLHLKPGPRPIECVSGHRIPVKDRFPFVPGEDAVGARRRDDPSRQRRINDTVSNELSREVIIIAAGLICGTVERKIAVVNGIDRLRGGVVLTRITGIDPCAACSVLGRGSEK
jgi:hypothetical protein